jgi:hypothetical protein
MKKRNQNKTINNFHKDAWRRQVFIHFLHLWSLAIDHPDGRSFFVTHSRIFFLPDPKKISVMAILSPFGYVVGVLWRAGGLRARFVACMNWSTRLRGAKNWVIGCLASLEILPRTCVNAPWGQALGIRSNREFPWSQALEMLYRGNLAREGRWCLIMLTLLKLLRLKPFILVQP